MQTRRSYKLINNDHTHRRLINTWSTKEACQLITEWKQKYLDFSNVRNINS